jgi:hypothetical protein
MAAITSGVVMAASAAYGASQQAGAAKDAARAQGRAADSANAEQRQRYETAREDLSPYRDAGTAALTQYNRLLGLGGEAPDYSVFTNSPDYIFARDQGNQAVERSAAARGGLVSGNTGAALQQYGQGLASQQLDAYTNRLAQLVGVGQSAATGTANLGVGTGRDIADTTVGAGNARASGIAGSANAWGNALSQIGGIAGDYFGQSKIQRQSGIGTPSRLGVTGYGGAMTGGKKWGQPVYGVSDPRVA